MRLMLALICGAIYPLGLAPFDIWPATLAAIALFFWILQDAPRPLLAAWLFGVGKYGVGASWIYVSINVYGNAAWPLAATLVALFVAGLALFVLPVGLAGKYFPGSQQTEQRAVAFIALWLLMDWVLTWFLTGFPWLFPGYAVMDTWLVGWAPVVGVLGVGLLVVSSVVCGWVAIVKRSVGWVLVAALPWPVGFGLAQLDFTNPIATQDVALVQGNIEQSTKWQRQMANPILDTYLGLSEPHWDADVLVWPEAAITYYPHQVEAWLAQLDAHAKRTATHFVTGIPTAERAPGGEVRLFNSVIGRGLAAGTFSKVHLVPFGEYVPLQSVLRGLIDFFDLPMSRMSAGNPVQANIRLQERTLAVAVCYEIAYPSSFRKRALDTALLATLSNDTWFGGSIGPHQHLQIARMRAVENGRWLLRATNNGLTAVVNPDGQIIAQAPQNEAAVARARVQLMEGHTPYARVGDVPFLVLLVILVAVLVRSRRRVANG